MSSSNHELSELRAINAKVRALRAQIAKALENDAPARELAKLYTELADLEDSREVTTLSLWAKDG